MGTQGNGIVRVDVNFGISEPDLSSAYSASSTQNEISTRLANRVAELAGAWRFSYMPGKIVSVGSGGPGIVDSSRSDGAGPVVWETTWSDATHHALDATGAALDATGAAFVAAVQRDVHRMLIQFETGAICDRFYIDGKRPWYLTSQPGPTPAISPSEHRPGRHPVAISINYDMGGLLETENGPG